VAERILKLHMFGIQTDLGHIPADASVQLEFSDPTDEDPIEWVNIHVRSSALPVYTEDREWDADADNTPGPMYTAREMLPRDALILDPNDVTVEQLKDIARDKELPVGGTKSELIERLNEDAVDSNAEGGPAAEPEEEAAYDEWTVEELKDALRSRDLPVSGNKAELVERLAEDDAV
jgi:uncharacterized protein YnzC (UPF0291/DUF896 family)